MKCCRREVGVGGAGEVGEEGAGDIGEEGAGDPSVV